MTGNWFFCRRILCMRIDNMGDVLMTTPAFWSLKQSFPRARLTLLTSTAGARVAPFIPEIDETITFDLPWIKAAHPHRNLDQIAQVLKQRDFDAAVIFSNYSQNPLPSALLAYMAGIPRCLSYSRENPYELISDWIPDTEPFTRIRHGVQRQIDLVSRIGARTEDMHLRMVLDAKTIRAARKSLEQSGLDTKKPFIVVHPGVSEKKRKYPVERLARAVSMLCEKTDMNFVFTGMPEDKAYEDLFLASSRGRGISLIGKTDVGTLAYLVSRARLAVANNTGIIHIAAAFKTATVVLYARTNPEHTPWMNTSRVLYYDVPPNERSKNSLLSCYVPSGTHPEVSPEHIMHAVMTLTDSGYECDLPSGILEWDPDDVS